MIIGVSGYINSGKDTVGIIIQYLCDIDKGGFEIIPSYQEWVIKQGKDKAIREAWSGWKIKKFAGKLKQIASILTGIPAEKFEDQDFKKTNLPVEWNYNKYLGGKEYSNNEPMTVREFLQKLGTEAIRNGIHTNAWVNALFADYKSEKWENELTVRHGAGWRDAATKKIDVTPERNPEYFYDHYPNWIITDTRFPNEAQAIKDRGGIIIRVNRNLPEVDYQTLEQRHPSETSLDDWKFDYVIENNGTIEQLEDKVKEILIKEKICTTQTQQQLQQG